MTKNIYAPALKKGDSIGVFSPSSPATVFAPKRYARAKAYLTSKGFNIIEGSLTGKSDSYRSGTIIERAKELNELIRNPNVRCIMSAIGGYNSNSLLPYIDYEALKKDPKIIIGYSDVTALLLGIYAKTGLVTFYGPAMVASFGEFAPLVDETYEQFFAMLSSNGASYSYTMPQQWTDYMIDWETQNEAKPTYQNQWQFLGSGVVTGRIIGGNLNTMGAICGSEYMPTIQQGDVLLIEDCLSCIATQERLFARLLISGVLDTVGAIILGKHELFDDKGTGRTPLVVLQEILQTANKTVPILYGFDSCHTHPMLTTPIGVQARIDFDNERVSLQSGWLQ